MTVLYLLGLVVIILYIFCESLPDQNTVIPSLYVRDIITNGMAAILAVNNAIIVPNLVRKGGFIGSRRIQLVMILRTINTLILPIIAALFLLNDCGRWWTKYWIPCYDENKYDIFSIDYPIDGVYVFGNGRTDMMINLFSPNDICDTKSILEINWSKCIRAFFYHWTFVIVMKFMISIIIPLVVMILKIWRHKLIRYYNEVWLKRDDTTLPVIKINSQYSMLMTAFEAILAFGIVCPLIIPVIMVGIDLNIRCYNLMIKQMKWQLTTYENISKSFPIYLLIVGLICGQILSQHFLLLQLEM